MREKKANKKLSLRKITIAHLSKKDIGHIYGGLESVTVTCGCPLPTDYDCESIGCFTVYRCTGPVDPPIIT